MIFKIKYSLNISLSTYVSSCPLSSKKIFIKLRFLSLFFVGVGVANTVGSGSSRGSGSGALLGFFVGNTLPLKLLRIFCLVLISNPAFFKKTFFQLVFQLYPYLLIHQITEFDLHQHLSMANFLCVYLLEKQ